MDAVCGSLCSYSTMEVKGNTALILRNFSKLLFNNHRTPHNYLQCTKMCDLDYKALKPQRKSIKKKQTKKTSQKYDYCSKDLVAISRHSSRTMSH